MQNFQSGVLTVRFNNTKNCFVGIPKNWTIPENQGPALLEVQLFTIKGSCHVTWAGERSQNSELTINRLFGNQLGLQDDMQVLVKAVPSMYVPPCYRATVQPLSYDDWELIELNADAVESQLMNQIRVIWAGVSFPIWVNKNICLFVTVGSVTPDSSLVLLQQETEVVVIPPGPNRDLSANRNTSKKQSTATTVDLPKTTVVRTSSVNQILNAVGNVFLNVLTPLSSTPQAAMQEPQPVLQESRNRTELLDNLSVAIHLRVVSLKVLLGEPLPEGLSPTTVFVNESTFGDSGINLPDSFLCSIRKLLSPAEKITVDKMHEEKGKSGEHTYRTETEIVRVILIRDFGSHPLPWRLHRLSPGSVAVPDLLRRQLGLEVTARIWLQSVTQSREMTLPIVVLHPLSIQLPMPEEKVLDGFRYWLNSLRLPLATSGRGTLIQIPRDGGTDLILKVEPPASVGPETKGKRYWLLKGTGHTVKVGPKVAPLHTLWAAHLPCKITFLEQMHKIAGSNLSDLGGVESSSTSILNWLHLCLRLCSLSKQLSVPSSAGQCLLVAGPKGVGKSALCAAICRALQGNHRHAHVHTYILQCNNLRGKRVESLKKLWQLALSESLHRQPTLLVFEDLDLIASAPSGPETEAGLDALYFSRISQTLVSLLESLHENRVAVIATCKSLRSLHPRLTASQGKHIFSKVVQLKPPDPRQRQEILECLMRVKAHLSSESIKNVSISQLAAKTEGYVAKDLETLVDRATHAAFCSETGNILRSSHRILTDPDFETALEGFCPSALCGLTLHSDPSRSWEDLGGLHDVKKTLLQTLSWPVKYPKLFSRSPLRLQSGILLYGEPGTGKTLLASIVAAECGLNFISIKGPELLSKYIGASEQSVRELFQRAQSAKPCILFFDEFDSIAPRRGHDSTGVTDRVVNQFLTQMDGVEALSGVYVLAATSRPDLIDPALLRPGRIDKCLFCPLPQQSEREEILECLSRHLNLDSSANLSVLAAKAENFTGADLQGLLYSAQLEALHDSHKYKGPMSETAPMLVSWDDVLYIPSLEEGPDDLEDPAQRTAVLMQMERLMENKLDSDGLSGRQRRKSSVSNPTIGQQHLERALDQTKQSIQTRDRRQFQDIYDQFQRSRNGEQKRVYPQQRATLA